MQTLILTVLLMVATYKPMEASFDGRYFTGGGSASYYTDGGDPPGQWFGDGIGSLNLSGVVDAQDFRRVLAGLHPHKPRQIVRPCMNDNEGDESKIPKRAPKPKPKLRNPNGQEQVESTRAPRCPAYDVTFSLPKSLSIVWAAGDANIRRQIDESLDIAVKKSLRWLERNVTLGRTGRAGKRKVRARLVVAMFDHFVNRSRTWEPHRHRHCVIANTAQLPDGSFGAVNSYELRKWIRMLGPMMGVHFAHEFKSRLGVLLERPTDERGRAASWYEVAGVPPALARLWSSRHAELHDLLAGPTIQMDHSTAQARDLAFKLTRHKKERTPAIQELLAQWEQETKRHGLDRRAVEQLLYRSQVMDFEAAYKLAWDAAAERLTKSEAYFNFREFLQVICEEIQHLGVDGDKLARRVKQDLEKSQEIVRLSKLGGEMRYTTKGMWRIEERLLKNIEQLKVQKGPLVSERIIQSVIKKRPHLDAEQQAAIRQLLKQPSGLRLLTGVAGSGKSAALDAVREALERSGSGYRIIGGAISGQAKEELAAKAQINSRTVESYLYHLGKSKRERLKETVRHHARMLLRALVGKSTWKQSKIELTKNSVLILDEIGMIDSRSLERLTHHAVKAGCTILGAGDDKQLQPVLAGGPIHHLLQRVGSAQLTKSYRQKDPLDVEAAQNVREGKAEEALANLAKRGRVTIGKDRSETIHKLVETWVKNGGDRRPQDHFVFVQTREEARHLNRLLQERRLQRQIVPRLASIRAGQQRIYRGDRVMFNVPYRAQGIENGFRGTVVSVNPVLGRLAVRLDREPNPSAFGKPKSQVVTVSLKALQKAVREPDDQAVSLAYASTTHKLQGGSTPIAYMLVGGQMTDREMSYTQLTRGVQKTFVFCDKLHAGDDLKGLARSMNKSRAKLMAHDIAPRETKAMDRPSLEISRDL